MVNRATRRISSNTARSMMTWSHYRFRTRLLDKTREFPSCKVIICDEAFTSKTCSECGCLNDKLGSSKTFRCNTCGQESDRDFNAARNILLRYLTLYQSSRVKAALSPTSLVSSGDHARLVHDDLYGQSLQV